jgi:FPC/CPF motif-containing protein YcgG
MPLPLLVFNMHEQFVALRAHGGYERMRDTIRRRDEELQGSINPMVSDHGESSEARQYSGRNLDHSWQAPFEADREKLDAS